MALGAHVFSERHDGVVVESREHTTEDGVVYVLQRGGHGWRVWEVSSGRCSRWMETRDEAVTWAANVKNGNR